MSRWRREWQGGRWAMLAGREGAERVKATDVAALLAAIRGDHAAFKGASRKVRS